MSKTVIADIRNNRFPKLVIEQETFVVWRNLDPYPHTVETAPDSSYYFNAGALFTGAVSSPVYFRNLGDFEYLCRFHHGMTGRVSVVVHAGGHDHDDDHDHGHDHHLQHFHGFVTGGRTGDRIFMSHTPVMADDRHHFQIILQASFVKDEHKKVYEKVRQSYGDGRMQTFHDHISLADIGSGAVTDLPKCELEYYPNPKTPDAGEPVPGLEKDIPIHIDKVLFFHVFEPDLEYPDGLQYLVYGDADDVFIDHSIGRAPSFHSVAKLAAAPDFWTPDKFGGTVSILVPSKRIIDVSPKILPRTAFVDNAFHITWLPPSNLLTPQDPLKRRDGSTPIYDVLLSDGTSSRIEIGRFLHFDIRLLNNRVVIT